MCRRSTESSTCPPGTKPSNTAATSASDDARRHAPASQGLGSALSAPAASRELQHLSDQIEQPRAADRFAAVSCCQLAVDALEVGLHGVYRNVHLAGDLGGAQHPRQVPEHFTLTGAEALDDQWRRIALHC